MSDASLTSARGQRVVWIDCLRAAVIVAVVVAHVADYWTDGTANAAMKMYLGSAVIFFMTSGALIFPVADMASFLRRRMRRVLPALCVWLLVYPLAMWGLGQISLYELGFTLVWLPFKPSFGAGWFCYALVGLYLFAPVLSAWLDRAPRRLVEAFIALWLLTGLLPYAHLFVDVSDTFATFLSPFTGYLGYMVAGHYLMRYPPSQWSARRRAAVLSALVMAAVVFGLWMLDFTGRYDLLPAVYHDRSVNVMAWSLLIFMAFGCVRSLPAPVGRAVAALSRWSYGIYLSHMAVFSFLVRPMQLSAAASVALTLAVAIALTALLWRSPLRRFTV